MNSPSHVAHLAPVHVHVHHVLLSPRGLKLLLSRSHLLRHLVGAHHSLPLQPLSSSSPTHLHHLQLLHLATMHLASGQMQQLQISRILTGRWQTTIVLLEPRANPDREAAGPARLSGYSDGVLVLSQYRVQKRGGLTSGCAKPHLLEGF